MFIIQRLSGIRFLGFPRRDHRRDVIDMLAAATDALRHVRRKAAAGRRLSQAEWTVVAHLAQQGIETAAMTHPNRLSADSLVAVLDAFAAVYDVRSALDARHDPYYLGNLPCDWRRVGVTDEEPLSNAVRTAVAETRRRLCERDPRCWPWLAGRNLRVLLDEDPLPSAAVIHRALRPHWPALWRLAVHGHDALTGERLPDAPCRDARGADDRRL